MVGRVRAPPVGRPYQVHPRTTAGRGYPVRVLRQSTATRSWLPATVRFSALLTLVIVLLGACSGSSVASFDPTGSCTGDGRAARAYPELEARVPTSYEGRGPDRLDSGRNSSRETHGARASAGIAEVRIAGGTGAFGGNPAFGGGPAYAPGGNPDFGGAPGGNQAYGGAPAGKPAVGGAPRERIGGTPS